MEERRKQFMETPNNQVMSSPYRIKNENNLVRIVNNNGL